MRPFQRLMIGAVAACVATVIALPGTAFADDSNMVPTAEVAAAVNKVDANNGDLIETAASSNTDADSAAQTPAVDIPVDPNQGVKFTLKNGKTLTIRTSDAKDGGKGQKTNKGIVVYSGKNGTANAAVPLAEGVQMLKVIKKKFAPTKYSYTLDQADAKFIVSQTGAVVIVDSKNSMLAAAPKPWAVDAKGKSVTTYFTTDGKTLTQHVLHKANGVSYPVTADPAFVRWWGVEFQLNRRQTNNVMFGMAGAAVAGIWFPDPVISKIIASVLGLYSGYANWIYNNGGCLAINVAWTGTWWLWHYYGGNCR